MIERPQPVNEIRRALRRSRVAALIGPRQCGKTTLARQIEPADSTNYFDLEDPASLARLEQPMTALESLRGIVVIDEVQHRPNLFPVLRVLARPHDFSFSAARRRTCFNSPRNLLPAVWKPCSSQV